MSGLSAGHCIFNLITNFIGNSSHFASIHSFIHSWINTFTFFCTIFLPFSFSSTREKKNHYHFSSHESLKDFKQTNKQTTFQTNSSKEINYLWSAIKIGLRAKLWYCKLQSVSFFAGYFSFCKLMLLDSGQWSSNEIDFSL